MNNAYYYADIREIIYQHIALYQQVESLAEEMVEAGIALSGLKGEGGDAFRERFSDRYVHFREVLVESREQAFKKIENLLDRFWEIESSESGVIYYSRLQENTRITNEVMDEITHLMKDYNALCVTDAYTGIPLETLPLEYAQEAGEELELFCTNLQKALEEADEQSSEGIRSSFAMYEKLMVDLLTLFDRETRVKVLTGLLDGLPVVTVQSIQTQMEEIELEEEIIAFEGALRLRKEELMADFFLETDQEFEDFLRHRICNKRIIHEYDPIVEAYNASFANLDELEIMSRLLNERSPQADVLFLSQITRDFDYNQSKAILSELKRNEGRLSKRFWQELGDGQYSSSGMAIMELIYRLTGNGMSLADAQYEWDKGKSAERQAMLELIAIQGSLKNAYDYNHPRPDLSNLDPENYFDRMELNSITGDVSVVKGISPWNIPAAEGTGGGKSPSELAQNAQGSGRYPGVDKYKDIKLKEGTVVYRGEPNGTEYFTTKFAINRSGQNATKVYEGLQVEKNPIHGYRNNMQGYKVAEGVGDINAAFGTTKANPQFGNGGLPQVFVPDANTLIENGVLIPVEKIPLK